MTSLSEQDIRSFLNLLGSDAPAPGGGSLSALMGACGVALGIMTTNLTLGRKKFEAEWGLAESVRDPAEKMVLAFLEAMDADTRAFDKVMEALHLPRETDEQRALRREAIQTATKEAVIPPFSILKLCSSAAELLASLVGHVNPSCASDLGVGAAALEAAAKGAWLNVCINLQSVTNEKYVADTYQEGRELLERVLDTAANIYKQIETDCSPAIQ